MVIKNFVFTRRASPGAFSFAPDGKLVAPYFELHIFKNIVGANEFYAIPRSLSDVSDSRPTEINAIESRKRLSFFYPAQMKRLQMPERKLLLVVKCVRVSCCLVLLLLYRLISNGKVAWSEYFIRTRNRVPCRLMTALLICIACNVGIFLAFRGFQHFRINTFQAITFNYCTCVLIGILFVGWPSFQASLSTDNPWLGPAVVLGFIFIGTFYFDGADDSAVFHDRRLNRKQNVINNSRTRESLHPGRSSKRLFSNELPGDGRGACGNSIKFNIKSGGLASSNTACKWYLPVLVFIFGGVIDTSMNYLNLTYVTDDQAGVFPIVIFLVAAVTGLIVLVVTPTAVSPRALLGGFLLGSVNYFSMFFLLRGLSSFQNDGALFFPLLNVGIILATAVVSGIVFREHFSKTNIAGLALSIAAIILLSYQELFGL